MQTTPPWVYAVYEVNPALDGRIILPQLNDPKYGEVAMPDPNENES